MKVGNLFWVKGAFSLMIIAIALVIFTGMQFTQEINKFNVWVSTSRVIDENVTKVKEYIPYIMNEPTVNNYSMSIVDYSNQTPLCDYDPTIILRLDDVKAWQYSNIITRITDDVLSKNMTITLGVIPKDIEKDKAVFLPWINNIKDNPNVEIALHGYLHQEDEFKNLTEEEAHDKIIKGKELLLKYAGVVPVTFIPPENEFSLGTINALAQENFKILAGGDTTLLVQYYPLGDNFRFLAKTTETYDFFEKKFAPIEQIIAECNQGLKKESVCVVMIHPQDYLMRDRTQIDEERYAQFIKLLDSLKKLDATFKNFKDVAQCKPNNSYSPS